MLRYCFSWRQQHFTSFTTLCCTLIPSLSLCTVNKDTQKRQTHERTLNSPHECNVYFLSLLVLSFRMKGPVKLTEEPIWWQVIVTVSVALTWDVCPPRVHLYDVSVPFILKFKSMTAIPLYTAVGYIGLWALYSARIQSIVNHVAKGSSKLAVQRYWLVYLPQN